MWFKVYDDILGDPKMNRLSNADWGIWLKLLALASKSQNGGGLMLTKTKSLDLEDLSKVLQTPSDDLYPTLKIFKVLEMVTFKQKDGKIWGKVELLNWKKRQGSDSPHFINERVKKHRYFKKQVQNVTDLKRDCNGFVTDLKRIDKIREDKIKIREKNIRKENTPTYLKELPEDDLKDWLIRFNTTKDELLSKAEDAYNWLISNGRSKRDYKAFFLNWIKRDLKERAPEKPPLPEIEITPEQIAKNKERLEEMRKILTKPL